MRSFVHFLNRQFGALGVALGIGVMTLVAACQLTGNISADSQAFAQEVAAFNQKANADIAAAASGTLIALKAAGQSACGFASEGDGLFQSVAKAGVIDPDVVASETGTMVFVKSGCAILDAADSSTPAASIVQAATSVIAALPQLKAALKAGDPAAAAIALAPPPATAATAPAAPSS